MRPVDAIHKRVQLHDGLTTPYERDLVGGAGSI